MATTNKYDRQLRLWGSNGQKLLSESCVVLVNATAVGTETVKNLVLPGIGSFHIIDDCESIAGSSFVTDEPFSNFFVFDRNGGKTRAQIARDHLLELNPDVKGGFTNVPSLEEADFNQILHDISKEHGHGRLLVVGADVPPAVSMALSEVCWKPAFSSSSIPLLLVQSYGLIGSVRVQTPYHPVIESKPDNSKPDLRLAMGPFVFPELHDYALSIDLDSLDNQGHGHVPYVVILLQALTKWRESQEVEGDAIEYASKLPKSFEEKTAFRNVIKAMSRNWNNEVNFQEADENAYLAYTVEEIPPEILDLLMNADEILKEKKSICDFPTVFDVLLVALKRFIDEKGYPPLNGSIPDMTSSTKSYIHLQEIYKKKADDDKKEMRRIVEQLVSEFGADFIPEISEDDLSILCKNIFNIRLVKTRSFVDEYLNRYTSNDEREEILEELVAATYDPYEVPEHTPLLWYIALRACDHFYAKHGYYPGKDNRELALHSDACELQHQIEAVVKMLGLENNDLVKSTLCCEDEGKRTAFAKEMTRYFNAEVHNISSVIGGVASQEAVKLITSQYIPIDCSYIFNGLTSVAGVYRL
jgi:amyloid beta precursor protein binding protein 1